MKTTHLIMVLAVPVLIACNNSGNNFVPPPTNGVAVTPPPAPPPPPPTSGEIVDGFGAGFSSAFNADATGQPIDPITGDIIAVDKTTDPIDIPNP